MQPIFTQQVWENIHASQPWGRYPSEEAVRFFMAHRGRAAGAPRALDIGAGAGAVAWFMARNGAVVTALEGSPSALKHLKETLAFFHVASGVTPVAGDITCPCDFVSGPFDLLIDHYSLYANHENRVREALIDYHRLLAPGGRMLSCLFGRNCSGISTGSRIATHTWENITNGIHANTGIVSLWTQEEAAKLFAAAGFGVTYQEFQIHDRGSARIEKIILWLDPVPGFAQKQPSEKSHGMS